MTNSAIWWDVLHKSCTYAVSSPVLLTYKRRNVKVLYHLLVFLNLNRLLLCYGQSMNVDLAILSAWPRAGTSAII